MMMSVIALVAAVGLHQSLWRASAGCSSTATAIIAFMFCKLHFYIYVYLFLQNTYRAVASSPAMAGPVLA